MTPFAPAVEKWHAFVVACINAIGEVSKQEAVDAIEGYGAELGLLEAGATDPAVATSSDQPQAVVAHHALSPSSVAPERGGALRERLAALAHEQWAGWMRYLFSRCEGPMPTWESDGLLMPIEWVKRWERQMNTPYADLSEAEKDSDRKEADRVLAALAFPEPLSERQQERDRPPGWVWQHEHQSALVARDGWMCEAHPGRAWPHDDCAGPGMPWMIEGRAAVTALSGEPFTRGEGEC